MHSVGSRSIAAFGPDRRTARLPIPADVIAAFEVAGWSVSWSRSPSDPALTQPDAHPAVLLLALQGIDPGLRAALERVREGPATARPLVVVLGSGGTMRACAELFDSVADLVFPLEAPAGWMCGQIQSVVDLIAPPAPDEIVSHGLLTLNPAIKRVSVMRDGQRRDTPLSPTECRLVGALMARPYRALDRDELLRAVWGPDCGIDLRTVDVHIRRLRGALERIGCAAMLQTVRGIGYRIVPD